MECQINQAIREGKISLAKEAIFVWLISDSFLRTALDCFQFEFLFELIQEASRKNDNTYYFWESCIIKPGRIDVIDFLFGEKKMDPNFLICEWMETTVLIEACKIGNRDMVERMLAYGANPELIDRDQQNAFIYASRGTDVNILYSLFLRTGRLDYLDRRGRTILHNAALMTTVPIEMIKGILNLYPPIINTVDEDGNTALHLEVKYTRCDPTPSECFLTLIDCPNIDLTIRNNRGKTALDMCEKYDTPMKEILRDRMTKPQTTAV